MNQVPEHEAAAAAPLLSEQWFRVSAVKPLLDEHARCERVVYRREVWHLLSRADGSRSFRMNAAAHAFVARCNGERSMQQLWEVLLAEWKDDAPTQDELLHLLARLHAAALVSFDRRPDFGPLGAIPQADTAVDPRRRSTVLAFRIPLGRPDAWLASVYPFVRPLFSLPMLYVLAALVGLAAVQAALHAAELVHYARTWLDTPRLLFITWMCYPLVKMLHEIGHGLAAKRIGAVVPEWGITMMMFMPVPYVDASATSAYAQRRQRLLVSAAGIAVELALASVGLLLALAAQPGWVRDIGLAVFFIGAVSTLLVNGNPFFAFDGYHVLTDLFNLPNLGPRSRRHWQETLRRHVLRDATPQPLRMAPGEAKWLWVYAPASLLWRTAAAVAVVYWLAGMSFVLGLAIAGITLWQMAGKPVLGFLTHLNRQARAGAQGAKVRLRGLAVLGAGALALLLLPMPFASVVQGVVWPDDAALLRAKTEGMVAEVLVQDGQAVQAGQPLLQLHSPALQAQADALAARAQALEAERYQILHSDPGRSNALERELQALNIELANAQDKLRHLQLVAEVDGRVALTQAADLPGRWLKQGALVGHIVTQAPSVVRVAVAQEQADLLHGSTRQVSVRLAEQGQPEWPAQWLRDAAGAVARLPSAALGDQGGGRVQTDPRDTQGLTPLQRVVLAEVRLPVNLGERTGGRAWVRFDHGWAPLSVQAGRAAQQLFLRHFNPAQ